MSTHRDTIQDALDLLGPAYAHVKERADLALAALIAERDEKAGLCPTCEAWAGRGHGCEWCSEFAHESGWNDEVDKSAEAAERDLSSLSQAYEAMGRSRSEYRKRAAEAERVIVKLLDALRSEISKRHWNMPRGNPLTPEQIDAKIRELYPEFARAALSPEPAATGLTEDRSEIAVIPDKGRDVWFKREGREYTREDYERDKATRGVPAGVQTPEEPVTPTTEFGI